MKKTIPSLAALFAAAAAVAADPEPVDLEPAGRDDPAWRVSVGLRAAPRVKTHAAVDSRAAVRAVGGVQAPAAPGKASSPAARSEETATRTEYATGEAASSGGTKVDTKESKSSSTSDPVVSGTTAADAAASAGYREDATRYDFDNGFIDLADAAGVPGETTNWHFDDASAFDASGFSIAGTTGYSYSETAVRTDVKTTTRTETTTSGSAGSRTVTDTRVSRRETVSGGGVSTSVSERYFDGPSDDSTDGACGLDLKLSRTIWENADFGLELGAGWTVYRDIDCFRAGGRVYEGRATATRRGETRTVETTTTRTATTTVQPGASTTTRTTTTTETTETTTTTTHAGSVATVIAQPEFTDLSDIQNPDGSIGGASYDGLPAEPGWGTPVLTVTANRFSVEDRPGASTSESVSTTSTATSETVSSTPGSGGAPSTSVSKSTETSRETTRGRDATAVATRTVDVRSRGELSMQELRLGLAPFWKASDRFVLRGDVGVVGVYAEVETRTTILVDGAIASSSTHTDDDWKFQGYAGLELAWRATERLELSAGAEVRFPDRRVRFDDGIVSGSVELPKWDAALRVSLAF